MVVETAVAYKNYTGGEWKEARSGGVLEVRNPANGELVCTAQNSTVEDAREAVAAAKEAFARSDWAENPSRRTRALFRLAEATQKAEEHLRTLLIKESGKIVPVARAEVERSVDTLEYYAGLARNIFGRSVTVDPSTIALLMREPVGVVATIAPWNMPLSLMVRSVAPALAAGNAVIMKPASFTPAATAAFVRLIDEIEDFPKGIVNFITGPGPVVGAELATHPDVDMVAFTGDTTTGREIMRLAAGTLKKVSLELGGKSPNVIFDDANFDRAIRGAINAASFYHAGQVCIAGTRCLVQKEMHEPFLERVRAITSDMKVGDPLKGRPDVGPVISEAQLNRILEYVEVGKRDAELVTGGYRLTEGDLAQGYFVAPTVFDRVPVASKIAQEEIFGPVLSVMTFADEEEAVTLANATIYGLAAAVWTKDINKALRFAKRVRAGQVWINTFGKLFPMAEMGGFKQSGLGRHYGLDGLWEFTELKNISIQLEE